jgi:formate--tetrahydrofolate ligase
LPDELNTPSLEKVQKGIVNLDKHIENIRKFQIEPVVAINGFTNDSEEEVKFIIDHCASQGVRAVLSEGWAKGGDGTMDLAAAVAEVVESEASHFKPLYSWESPVVDKIDTIAKEIYGASHVSYTKKAKLNLRRIKRLGFENFAICIAKTQKSFSDDEKLIGRPENFEIHVREIEIAAGAGFVIPIVGKMMRMPGLPSKPASEGMSIDNEGTISGLS